MVAQESTPIQFTMNSYVFVVVVFYSYTVFWALFMHAAFRLCKLYNIFDSIRYARCFIFVSLCPDLSTLTPGVQDPPPMMFKPKFV